MLSTEILYKYFEQGRFDGYNSIRLSNVEEAETFLFSIEIPVNV